MRNKYRGEDIRARLGSTVLRYKGKPYFCEVDGYQLLMYDLNSNTLCHRIEADDPGIDISSITLGYMNIDNSDHRLAVYLSREGRRQYKQGVDLSHLTQYVLRDKVNQVHWSLLKSKNLLDSIEGRFPSFEQAVSKLTKGGYFSVALNRDVAIKREEAVFKVYVKTDEVGFIRAGTSKVIVPNTATSFIDAYFLREINGWEVVEGNK